MSVLTLEAKLERLESATPWGFRMQGGKDFHSPLTIQRVTPGSLASKCGLLSGDIILKIGKSEADVLKHKEAQDTIISCGNKLDLLLQRIRDKKKVLLGIFGGAVPDINRLHINSSPTPPPSLRAPSPTPAFRAPSPTPPPIIKAPSPIPFAPSPPPPPPPSVVTNNAGVNYNATARPFPFGSAGVVLPPLPSEPSFPPPPPPTTALFQPSVEKYTTAEEERPVSTHQSRSFKLLQGLMDSGQEPPPSLRPLSSTTTPNGSRSVSPQPFAATAKPSTVKAIGNWQYNTPIGLYSRENLKSTFVDQSKILTGQEMRGPVPQFTPAPPLPPANPEPVTYIPPPPHTPMARPAPPVAAPPAPAPAPAPTGAPARSFAAIPPPAAPAHVPAPAPPRPKAPPAKPTGVGATKGKRGDAVYRTQDSAAGRIPVCAACGTQIRGPFVLAMSKSWCPEHFVCANPNCGVKLFDIGFVEEGGYLYCERDYEQFFAPHCSKCSGVIIGECVNALNTTFHPQCFTCVQCKKPMGNSSFHIEDGEYYCDDDWKAQFQAVCFGCKYAIDPGDRWVEALDHSYHSDCFTCTTCHVSLEGQPFYAKAGKPFCKKHAR